MDILKVNAYVEVLQQLGQFFVQYHQSGMKLSDVALMSSIVSVLKNNMPNFFFVGFYIVVDEQYLEIGPYQSTILATPRIAYGKGQCGSAWKRFYLIIGSEQTTQLVNDVSECKNYIACDPDTKSEIVVPAFNSKGEVIAVLDIDATIKDFFTSTDKHYLELIVNFMRE